MYTSKSLLKAESEAYSLSKKNKETAYYVLTKKNKPAKCFSLKFAIREAILDGYNRICYYKNGERIEWKEGK